MCKKPFRQGVAEFGCGQCMPCRVNRRRLWCSRIMLETTLHAASYFVTLTYSPEYLPDDKSVSIRHCQLFLKRLRRLVEPLRFRYYIVGEYGERSLRPHYHAVFFGLPLEDHKNGKPCECYVCRSWTDGYVYIGSVTAESASYVAGYCTKKLTKAGDARLQGRHPEFARMSLRPWVKGEPGGIGGGAVKALVDAATTDSGSRYLIENGDVFESYTIGKKRWPLGRYLRRCVRAGLGWDPGEPPAKRERRDKDQQIALRIPGAFVAHEDKRRRDAQKAKVVVRSIRGKEKL